MWMGALPAGAGTTVPSLGEGSSRISKHCLAAAIPLLEAWNIVPTWRTGSNTSGASMMITRPLNRSRSPWTILMPTCTATSATDRVERNSSTPPERNATLRVCGVVRVFWLDRRTKCSRGACSRPKAFSVGIPVRTSRSWAPRRSMATSFFEENPDVILPMRTMKMGIIGSANNAISADQKSKVRIAMRVMGVTVTTRSS